MNQIVLVLDRLRSAENVGNIFRIAEATGVSEIIGCGSTPLPPHPKLLRTAMGTETLTPSRYVADTITALQELKQRKFTIWAAEPGNGALPVSQTPLQFPLALVLGNEALGIAPEALQLCDQRIELPMAGFKASVNVGNAAAAILFMLRARESEVTV